MVTNVSEIQAVAIVDDVEDSRDTFSDNLANENYRPKPMKGPFANIQALLNKVQHEASAAVCDHHLISNYVQATGAATVAALYDRQFPAVLVTKYNRADIDLFRQYRRRMPVLLSSAEADEIDHIRNGWSVCLNEFRGLFSETRRPWRTMLRVDDVDSGFVFVTIPSWNSREVIRLPSTLFPHAVFEQITLGHRLFADVNKGAERQEDLFFENLRFND